MNNYLPLSKLLIDEKGKVDEIIMDGAIKRRLLDLGLIKGTIIKVLQKGPFGDPVAYLIRGTVIALRSEISSQILVSKV